MIKAGLLVVLGLIMLAVVGPSAGAVGDYLIRPHKLSCDDYDINVPMKWKVPLKKCEGEVLLERRSDFLFDSGSGHQLIFIRSLAKRRTSMDQEDAEFREAHPGKAVTPVRVNDLFTKCLRTDGDPDDPSITVFCVDIMNQSASLTSELGGIYIPLFL